MTSAPPTMTACKRRLTGALGIRSSAQIHHMSTRCMGIGFNEFGEVIFAIPENEKWPTLK